MGLDRTVKTMFNELFMKIGKILHYIRHQTQYHSYFIPNVVIVSIFFLFFYFIDVSWSISYVLLLYKGVVMSGMY